MPENLIIAVVGLPGSGKTECAKYIETKKNFIKVYFGDSTFEELKKRELQVNETNERMVRENLRQKHGMGAYAILNIPKIDKGLKENNVVVESLYSWHEYKILKDKYKDKFKVIAVYSSPHDRYLRLSQRLDRKLTLEEAVRRDISEIENLAVAGPITMADYTILNDKSLDNLFQKTEKIISQLSAKCL